MWPHNMYTVHPTGDNPQLRQHTSTVLSKRICQWKLLYNIQARANMSHQLRFSRYKPDLGVLAQL